MVELLLDKGSDIEASSSVGSTALMHASRYGHEAVVKLLLDSGARLGDIQTLIHKQDVSGKLTLLIFPLFFGLRMLKTGYFLPKSVKSTSWIKTTGPGLETIYLKSQKGG